MYIHTLVKKTIVELKVGLSFKYLKQLFPLLFNINNSVYYIVTILSATVVNQIQGYCQRTI